MNKLIKTSFMMLLLVGVQTTTLMAQIKNSVTPNLTSVRYEVEVEVTPQQAWEVLANYGDAGGFHAQLESSKSINGSASKASLGCERECVIPDGKKKIVVKEKIFEYVEGQYYTYEVYEWKNFPINTFHVTFGVKTDQEGKTIIYQVNDYRLKPGVLTKLMKRKIRSGARDGLLAYKHYMETGERDADMESIRKRYKHI